MSSFALEYRKKMQAERTETKPRVRKAAAAVNASDFVMAPAGKSSDTPGNSRRVLAALLFAGLILSVFNSSALVQYAGGLGYNQAAMRVIIASENWHALMEQTRMTALVEGVREAVTTARHSQWRDLAFGLDLGPNHPYLRELLEPEIARENATPPIEEPGMAPPEAVPGQKHDNPMMRAAAGR